MVSGLLIYLFAIVLLLSHLFIPLSAQHRSIDIAKVDTIVSCDGKTEAIISTDKNGFYHGQVKKFYKNGILASSQLYQHGIKYGQSTYFTDQGDTSYVCNWSENILNGPVSAYIKSRKLFTENFYAGKLQGLNFYFDSTGKPLNGLFHRFYFEGSNYTTRLANCTAGKPNGEILVYNGENGSLIRRVNYKDGLVDGKSYHYLNDTLACISSYEKGNYLKEDDINYPYHLFIYNNFLQHEPNNDHFLYQRALTYLRIGRTKNSLEDLNKVISIKKDHYKAYYNRAVILGDSLPKAAMKDLAITLKIKKDFYLAYYNLGILYYRDSQYKKARNSFESCIKFNPTHLPSIHNLAMVYGLLGDNNMQEYYKKEFDRIISAK